MDVREKLSTEKRLIDVDALLEKMKRTSRYFDVLFDVEEMPTVDAVEVIRCRECKFGIWDSEPDDAMVCVRTNDGFWRSGNDFCSRGKRKEGDGNG